MHIAMCRLPFRTRGLKKMKGRQMHVPSVRALMHWQ